MFVSIIRTFGTIVDALTLSKELGFVFDKERWEFDKLFRSCMTISL